MPFLLLNHILYSVRQSVFSSDPFFNTISLPLRTKRFIFEVLRVNPFFQATRFLYNFVQIPFSILIQNAHLCTNSSQPQPFSFTPLIQHFVRTFFSEITFCKRKQLPLKPLLTITTAAAAASAAAACGLLQKLCEN